MNEKSELTSLDLELVHLHALIHEFFDNGIDFWIKLNAIDYWKELLYERIDPIRKEIEMKVGIKGETK